MLVETHLPLGKVDPGVRKADRPVTVDRIPEDASRVELAWPDLPVQLAAVNAPQIQAA